MSDQFHKMRSLERGGFDPYELDDFRDPDAKIPAELRNAAFKDLVDQANEPEEDDEPDDD